jgi:hypothetical protein
MVAGYFFRSFWRRAFRHAVADAWEFGELLFVFGQVFDALVEALEKISDLFVAAVAADHGTVDLEKPGGFPKDFGYVAVFH